MFIIWSNQTLNRIHILYQQNCPKFIICFVCLIPELSVLVMGIITLIKTLNATFFIQCDALGRVGNLIYPFRTFLIYSLILLLLSYIILIVCQQSPLSKPSLPSLQPYSSSLKNVCYIVPQILSLGPRAFFWYLCSYNP